MKTLADVRHLLPNLTEKEFVFLEGIVGAYSIDDNLCMEGKLTPTEKGLFSSLLKKELVYDSFDGMHDEQGYTHPNLFPCEKILDLLELEHY